MAHLKTNPNIAEPDRFYERLIDLHRDLDEAASAATNARLILVLANHIGDIEVLEEALALAGRSGGSPAPAAEEADAP